MELQRKSRTVQPAGPVDGGYGWFIVLSTFLVFGLTFGVIKSFGVFFIEIHHYFATTATASSWITSISVATVHFGGMWQFKVSTSRERTPLTHLCLLMSCMDIHWLRLKCLWISKWKWDLVKTHCHTWSYKLVVIF